MNNINEELSTYNQRTTLDIESNEQNQMKNYRHRIK